MLEELNTTELHALTANAALFIVAAICPILLAPLSGKSSFRDARISRRAAEQFGRRSLMLASNVLQTLLYLPQGLAPNVETIIGVRAIQGVAGSAGNSLVGGFGWSSGTEASN
jgi:MFS family permease